MSNQVVEYIPEAVPVTLVSFMAKIITNIAEDTKAQIRDLFFYDLFFMISLTKKISCCLLGFMVFILPRVQKSSTS